MTESEEMSSVSYFLMKMTKPEENMCFSPIILNVNE